MVVITFAKLWMKNGEVGNGLQFNTHQMDTQEGHFVNTPAASGAWFSHDDNKKIFLARTTCPL
jgi:hypothetical protein